MRRTANWQATSNSIAEMAATTRPKGEGNQAALSLGDGDVDDLLGDDGTSAPRSPAAAPARRTRSRSTGPRAALQQDPRPQWPIRKGRVKVRRSGARSEAVSPVTFCLVPSGDPTSV